MGTELVQPPLVWHVWRHRRTGCLNRPPPGVDDVWHLATNEKTLVQPHRCDRTTCHIAGCCYLANSMSWSQSYVSHCRVLPPGEFNGISSQSHVPHCRVLPLGEFTVVIPEPYATLQGAVIWRNQCHDRATLQGVITPSSILKIVFRHILFVCFLMQFGLWRAAAIVSSPIHLLK